MKLESTLSALAGLHSGEVVYVCTGSDVADRIPREAITISVDGAWSPAPATFALLTTRPASVTPADIVVSTGRYGLDRPFVILVRTGSGSGKAGSNILAVSDEASPVEIGRALAGHIRSSPDRDGRYLSISGSSGPAGSSDRPVRPSG